MTENGSEYNKYKNAQLNDVPKFIKKQSAPTNSTGLSEKEKAKQLFINSNPGLQGSYWAGQAWKEVKHEKMMYDVAAGRVPQNKFDSPGDAITVLQAAKNEGFLPDVSIGSDAVLKIHDGFAGPSMRLYDAVLQLAATHEKSANGKLLMINLLKPVK